MDGLLYALIEAERDADEVFEAIGDSELAPVTVVIDEDDARVETYADGSYVAFGPDGALL